MCRPVMFRPVELRAGALKETPPLGRALRPGAQEQAEAGWSQRCATAVSQSRSTSSRAGWSR